MARSRLVLWALALLAFVPLTGGATAAPGAAIVVPPSFALTHWTADTDNLVAAHGTVTLAGVPVSGVRMRVDGYDLAAPTDRAGRFVYLADATRLARHVVSVSDAGHGRAGGRALTDAQRSALTATSSAITVAYPIRGVSVTRDGRGNTVVKGRIAYADGTAPPLVSHYSYSLTGTVTDADGKPVAGARVSTRTVDRDYWTVSTATDSQGRFSSLFSASDETGRDPVPMTVRVAVGDLVYQFLPEEYVRFKALSSATLALRLPPRGYPMPVPLPRPFAGAIYEGVVVGVADGARVLRPSSVTWPDASGRFTIVLAHSAAGRPLSLWEAKVTLFSRSTARPGGPIDLRDWPRVLAPDVPRQLGRVSVR